MSKNQHRRSWALATGVLATLWVCAGAVQAREVVWSVGVGSPGVQVDVTNARPSDAGAILGDTLRVRTHGHTYISRTRTHTHTHTHPHPHT